MGSPTTSRTPTPPATSTRIGFGTCSTSRAADPAPTGVHARHRSAAVDAGRGGFAQEHAGHRRPLDVASRARLPQGPSLRRPQGSRATAAAPRRRRPPDDVHRRADPPPITVPDGVTEDQIAISATAPCAPTASVASSSRHRARARPACYRSATTFPCHRRLRARRAPRRPRAVHAGRARGLQHRHGAGDGQT